MQILLKALVAETSEGRKPTNLIDLAAEDQTLFAEVFGLEESVVEASRENGSGLAEIASQFAEVQAEGKLVDGDILLPELTAPAPRPAPTVIEVTPLAADTVENDVLPDESGEAIEFDPQETRFQKIPDETGSVTIESQVSLAELGLVVPAVSGEPERKEERAAESIALRRETPAPVSESTFERATIAALKSEQEITVVQPDALDAAEADVETAARSVAPESVERQGPRELPLPIVRPQTVETPVRPKLKNSDLTEVLSKAEPIDLKTTQTVQNTTTTPATKIQTPVVSTPVAQLSVQNEKGAHRDSILGSENITAATTVDSNDAKRSTTNSVRSDPVVRPVLNQVVQLAFRAAVDGVVEVRLQPEELGRLRIAMTQMDAGVVVQVSAERPETLDLLRRNIDMLERDLLEQGFKNPSFSFGQGSTDAEHNEDSAHELTRETKTNTHIEIDVHPEQVVVNDGRLDIRL